MSTLGYSTFPIHPTQPLHDGTGWRQPRHVVVVVVVVVVVPVAVIVVVVIIMIMRNTVS